MTCIQFCAARVRQMRPASQPVPSRLTLLYFPAGRLQNVLYDQKVFPPPLSAEKENKKQTMKTEKKEDWGRIDPFGLMMMTDMMPHASPTRAPPHPSSWKSCPPTTFLLITLCAPGPILVEGNFSSFPHPPSMIELEKGRTDGRIRTDG